MASCSRDSTVRIWSLSHLACSLQIDVLANRPLDDIVAPSTGNVVVMLTQDVHWLSEQCLLWLIAPGGRGGSHINVTWVIVMPFTS